MKKLVERTKKSIHTKVSPSIQVTSNNGCIVLEGELDNWDDVVQAGRLAVHKKSLGVINNIKLKGFRPTQKSPTIKDNLYNNSRPDVLIIGAGVVGCAIARELSKYKLDIMLVDKDYDVAMAASSRNDGDIHVGIDLHKHQQKHYYNSRGNKLYDKLSEELDVTLKRTGHIIIFKYWWEKFVFYPLIKLKAKSLGISGIRYATRKQLQEVEPGIPSWSNGGVIMATGAEISPYKLTVALAENAAMNGVKVCLNTIVNAIDVDNNTIQSVTTNRGKIYPALVINAAGVFSDIIADMAKDRTFTIHPRKGTNLILDKKCSHFASTSMNKSPLIKFANEKDLPAKSKYSKGGGVVHTVDNNVLVGPTATETPYREDNTTTKEEIDTIMLRMSNIAENMKYSDVITYFSGTRAPTYEEDFVVRKGIFTKNIIHAAGIQSPGLTAAPAIAKDITKWAIELLGTVASNKSFNPYRKGIPHLASLPPKERDQLIKDNPNYGEIICRCEEVSKGEIIDCLNSPLPVYTVDAIKRRVRPGMGRCQGGFCSPLVMQIIADHKGISLEEVTKANQHSKVLYADTKGESTND